MDSLTQIVLGAACGQAVLGKKIGNKALLFGAIGGTIPDLDVIVGGLIHQNKIDAMLFHRGFMHSILFSVLAAFFLGWFVFKVYNTKKRIDTTSQSDWVSLFFWSLLTHPILDCFTPYGTQLFAPFSNYRVAFNNIAVVDPLYTVPFLVCIIVLMFFKRTSIKRITWLKWGIGISSVYMLFTVVNKLYIDSVFRTSLAEKEIEYYRYSSNPALLNNILWYGIAETKTGYFIANYSLLDTKSSFINFVELPKQRDLKPEAYQDIKDLAWFSNGYYSVYKMEDNNYQYNDLRYPLLDDKDPNSSVFKMKLFKEGDRLNMIPFEPESRDFKAAISNLWERTKGI
ncbi:metal-dependent hydrolase [Algibacter sp. TI.3.09]|uniref:metal-dependent hydrolase n=1 Tax=Algibacter sp. TI.3.09 TaxID=3121298 RepID=UPI00311F11E6